MFTTAGVKTNKKDKDNLEDNDLGKADPDTNKTMDTTQKVLF